jgi:hypothetical protein
MGLLDYFKKDAADVRKRERCRGRLTNMYYQQADRMAAADQAYELALQGDEEAVNVLLVRFEHLCPSTTVDREEKEHVVNLLVALGDKAVPAIESYCLTLRKPIYWPVRVLEDLWPRERVDGFLADVLEKTDNDYWRDPEKKIGLLQMVSAIPGDRITRALLPFVDDQLEEVRFKAVDALVQRAADVRDVFLPRLAGEEESGRIIARLTEAFAERAWSVQGHEQALAPRLPRGFRVVDGVVARS